MFLRMQGFYFVFFVSFARDALCSVSPVFPDGRELFLPFFFFPLVVSLVAGTAGAGAAAPPPVNWDIRPGGFTHGLFNFPSALWPKM